MDENLSVDDVTDQLDDWLNAPNKGTYAVVDEKKDHPRLYLYKNKSRAAEQERRWRQHLAELRTKCNRRKIFDINRSLPESMDNPISNPWSSKSPKHVAKSWRHFSKYLMLAEWFLFVPPKFHEEYLMKLCPKGRHVLVKASKGSTKVYSRIGKLLFQTLSRLPGGGLGQSENQNQANCTILDCILSSTCTNLDNDAMSSMEIPMEFYVLDLQFFRSTSYTQLSFRERCDWIENFLKEQIEQFENEEEPVRFHIVPSYSCELKIMQSVLSVKPNVEIDGILFYHGEVNYEPGATPLVGWLKPYMLSEWFPELVLHSDYMLDIPTDYTNYLNEIRLNEDAARQRKKTENKTDLA